MDARAEAEKRYPDMYADGQKYLAFLAGAAWALREAVSVINAAREDGESDLRQVRAWIENIADGIEDA